MESDFVHLAKKCEKRGKTQKNACNAKEFMIDCVHPKEKEMRRNGKEDQLQSSVEAPHRQTDE